MPLKTSVNLVALDVSRPRCKGGCHWIIFSPSLVDRTRTGVCDMDLSQLCVQTMRDVAFMSIVSSMVVSFDL